MLLFNIPLFALSCIIGPVFGAKTLFGTSVVGVCGPVQQFPVPVTEDLLLCAIYGGVLSGIGRNSLSFRVSTGEGTDIDAAQLVDSFPPVLVRLF